MIPERSLDVYDEEGQVATRIQRHPDGTLLSKTLDFPVNENDPNLRSNMPKPSGKRQRACLCAAWTRPW